jgi:tetratricopeptide (TPR) repeat protein
MNEPSHPDVATVDLLPQPKPDPRRERFAAAWEQALRGGIPPRIDDFLAEVSAAERDALRRQLEHIDDKYRAAGTIEFRAPPGSTMTSAGTVDLPAADDGTVDAPAQPAPDKTQQFSVSAGPPVVAAAAVHELPNVAGYQILGVLGRGAMGVVYKARQRGLQRLVALKMILAGGHASPGDVARFRSEAEAVGQLQHPNIVQVYEVGDADGCPFFSLEFVDGGSLHRKIAGEPQPILPAAHLVQLLARAMDAAHQKGIVHRDLKPGNVMLTQPRPAGSASTSGGVSLSEPLYGVPKIADFGLAKRLEDESGQTRSGTILGTPSYMAPEQAEGRSREVGPLADVYALGAILYELLTGRPPFRGATMWDTLDQVRHREPVPPAQLQPKVPRDLETICLKCLQKEAGRRYAGAGELADDLGRFLAGEPIRARPVGAVERGWRWCRRNPIVAALAAAVFVSLLAGVVVASFFAVQASSRADQLADEKVETERQRDKAVAQEKLAKKNEAEAIAQQKRAKENEDKAVAQKTRAELTKDAANRQREVAEAELKTMIDLVVARFKDTGKLTPEAVRNLRELLLLQGAQSLGKIADIAAKNADFVEQEPGLAQRAHAKALFEIAKLYRDANDNAKALDCYRHGAALLAELARDPAGGDKARGNLAVAHLVVGDMIIHMQGPPQDAQKEYLQAVAAWQLVLDQPRGKDYPPLEVRKRIADLQSKLAVVAKRLGDPAQAKEHYLANLAYYRHLPRDRRQEPIRLLTQAGLYLSLADVSWRLGDEAAMAEYQDKCLAVRRFHLDVAGHRPSVRQTLAGAYDTCGDGWLRLGKLDKARDYYLQARQLLTALAEDDPNLELYKGLLSNNHYRLGTVELLTGNRRRAAAHFRAALELCLYLARKNPDQAFVLAPLARCGEHEKSAAMADRLAKAGAGNPEALLPLGCCYALCAEAVGAGHPLFEGYVRKALDTLGQATPETFKDVRTIETDPELAVLRELQGYRDLVARLRKQGG